jgi:muconolactone delta-isomerase
VVSTVPEGTSGDTVEDTKRREAARTKELAVQGHLLRLWKPREAPSEWRTFGLFNATDEDELRQVLALDAAARVDDRHGHTVHATPKRPRHRTSGQLTATTPNDSTARSSTT